MFESVARGDEFLGNASSMFTVLLLPAKPLIVSAATKTVGTVREADLQMKDGVTVFRADLIADDEDLDMERTFQLVRRDSWLALYSYDGAAAGSLVIPSASTSSSLLRITLQDTTMTGHVGSFTGRIRKRSQTTVDITIKLWNPPSVSRYSNSKCQPLAYGRLHICTHSID